MRGVDAAGAGGGVEPVTYRNHGHVPSDDEIAAVGFKAFGPRRPPFEPTKDDFQRAHADTATGDPGELAGLAAELADLWPGWFPCFPWGYGYCWDDDE
jgi:hypothetical protein